MAHTFLNLGFETAEAIPGDAFAWGQTIVSSLVAHANFGFTSASPFEIWDEGWNNSAFVFLFAQTDLAQAQFPSGDVDPLVAESFEVGWINDTFSFGLGSIDDAEFDAGSVTFEDYEDGWSNDTWEGTLSGIAVGLFDSGANDFESFNFAFVLNASNDPLWLGHEESYDASVGAGVGMSPSNLPVGVIFSNGPDLLTLPAGNHDFEDFYAEIGDTIWIRGSDIGDSNGTRVITSIAGNVIGVDFAWDTTGTATTGVHVSTLNNAAFVNHGGGGTPNFVAEPEFFDTGSFDAMDTI